MGSRMESPLLFFLILTAITSTDPVHSQMIYPSKDPVPLGDDVTLISNTSVNLGTWTFNNNLLALIYPGGVELSTAKNGRLIFDSNTSSLTIISAQLNDSGTYKLEKINGFSVELQLSVQERISNVTLSAQRTDLVEFKDTAVFTCSVSAGTSLSYKWLAGNSEISAGAGVQFSNGGANLSIVNVTRYDQGPYQCNVSNGLGSKISPPVNLNISYGPYNATMTVDPVEYMYRSGSNITLSCSVESNPTATVQWMFNGTNLDQFGLQLHLDNVKENNSGIYECLFHNTVTMRSSNDSTEIRVMDPISAVVISPAHGPAKLHEAFTLQCEATGRVDSIQWWKNDSLITPDNRTMFDSSNKTLTLNPVQLSDGGSYMCHVSNLVSAMTSDPFDVVVNYGPWMPTVTGPNVGKSGSTVTFKCTAESVPESHYQWHFNGYVVSNMSEYTTPPLTKNMSGNFICMALNDVTGRNSTASIMLTVIDPIQSVEIQPSMNYAMENYSYNLTCNVAGPADHIYWMKSGNLLLADNRTVFNMNNKTIMFLALNRSDTGNYTCMAANAVGNMTSAHYELLVIYGPEMATIWGRKMVKRGSNVTLSCNAPSHPTSMYTWYFNDTLVSNESQYVTPPVTEEKSLKCMAFNSITNKNSTASITITLIESIKNVQIDVPTWEALEGDWYHLMCNVTGTVDNIYWMKNGEQMHPDNNTAFFMDNNTLKFMPVDRYDAGHYECMAMNDAGNLTSSAYMLQVIFGPDEPIIYGPHFGEAGRNAVFNCSAASMPPSNYSWWFNDSLMANTSEFTAGPLSFNMSGTYKCMAHNEVTGNSSAISTMLTVIEGIDAVMIQSNSTPISGENFTLTCLVDGPYDDLNWTKDGMELNLNDSDPASSMYITDENILHFTQLTTQSNGAYRCVASNQAASHWSPQYKLLVRYGPLNVNISGPGSAKNGASVSLKCAADSYPECDFHWFFNNQSSPLRNGSVYSFLATKGQVGKYICIATNPVTNITMTQTKSFAIEDHASPNHIANKGAVLLMGLGSVFVHLLLH